MEHSEGDANSEPAGRKLQRQNLSALRQHESLQSTRIAIQHFRTREWECGEGPPPRERVAKFLKRLYELGRNFLLLYP